MINDLSCKISQQSKDKWATTCTASYASHDNYRHDPWTVKFQPRKSETAANKDADQWIKKVLKFQAITRPVDVNQLKKEKR